MSNLLQIRRAQRRFIQMESKHRMLAFLARRQFGKTTTFAKVALKKMMKTRNHTVIFGSAKLNLSREIVRMEAAVLQATISQAIAESHSQAKAMGMLAVYDSATQKSPSKLTADDFAAMFEAQRLEFRFYHDRGSYSRTKVVALRSDAVGETGDLMCDEIGRVKDWRDVWEAVSPIVASNPAFRILFSTTPPPDDTHYSFDMLSPPVGTVFVPNPDGNVYMSEMGVTVLRVDAWDAFLDGVPVYDLSTGEPLAPEESRRREQDKDAWDRNYGCKFVLGGVGACGLMALDTAQRRGIGQAAFVNVTCDSDFDLALESLTKLLGAGKVGIGVDVATTTAGVSNPTAVTICEQDGTDFIARLIVIWKTADPAVARDRIRRIVETVERRPDGGRARRLCVDATSERYFAVDLRTFLMSKIPVKLVIGSETVERPGYGSQTLKQVLGNQCIGSLDDNRMTLPPERYVRDDWRLEKKEKGLLVCTVDTDGKHGDTFDSTKLAIDALLDRGGSANVDFAASINGSSVQGGTARDPHHLSTWINDATSVKHMAG